MRTISVGMSEYYIREISDRSTVAAGEQEKGVPVATANTRRDGENL